MLSVYEDGLKRSPPAELNNLFMVENRTLGALKVQNERGASEQAWSRLCFGRAPLNFIKLIIILGVLRFEIDIKTFCFGILTFFVFTAVRKWLKVCDNTPTRGRVLRVGLASRAAIRNCRRNKLK